MDSKYNDGEIQKTLSKNNKKEYSNFKNELTTNKYLVNNIVKNTEKVLECNNDDWRYLKFISKLNYYNNVNYDSNYFELPSLHLNDYYSHYPKIQWRLYLNHTK